MILEKIQQIFREIFADQTLVITEETNSENIPEWDSFAQVLIVEMVEKTFDIKMDLDEVFKINSISDFIKIIEVEQNEEEH
ncbi:acyl carrier protein [Lachnospiraceae bacterium 54-11]